MASNTLASQILNKCYEEDVDVLSYIEDEDIDVIYLGEVSHGPAGDFTSYYRLEDGSIFCLDDNLYNCGVRDYSTIKEEDLPDNLN